MDPLSTRPLRTNAHTHTVFCDGTDTPKAMVEQALSLGFTSLGFSSHSDLPGEDWCLSTENTPRYREEINRLKLEYQNKIKLYLGLELDALSNVDLTPYDYLIASVHRYSDGQGNYYDYDNTPENFLSLLNEVHGGDFLKLSGAYYEKVLQHVVKTVRDFSGGPVIIGHFDLITKFNRQLRVIDEDDPVYRSLASEALLESCKTGAIAEINTGAIAQKHTKTPYPAFGMLKLLKEHHYPVMINSDCHQKEDLTAFFAEAVEYARAAGYRSVLGLGVNSTLEEIPL